MQTKLNSQIWAKADIRFLRYCPWKIQVCGKRLLSPKCTPSVLMWPIVSGNHRLKIYNWLYKKKKNMWVVADSLLRHAFPKDWTWSWFQKPRLGFLFSKSKPKQSFGNELVPIETSADDLLGLSRKLIHRQLLASIIIAIVIANIANGYKIWCYLSQIYPQISLGTCARNTSLAGPCVLWVKWCADLHF